MHAMALCCLAWMQAWDSMSVRQCFLLKHKTLLLFSSQFLFCSQAAEDNSLCTSTLHSGSSYKVAWRGDILQGTREDDAQD